MKVSKKIIASIIGVGIIVGGGFFIHNNQMNNLFDKRTSNLFDIKKQSLEHILDNAHTFKLEKQIFSLKKTLLCIG